MVNGPGTVILILRAVLARRNSTISDLYRMAAADPPYDARHNRKTAGTIGRLSRVIEIDAVERGGKAIGVALPTLLTVADNIDPGAFLIANGEKGGIVLCRFKPLRVDEPKVVCAYARYLLRQPSTIDQPFGLRIRADQGGGKQHELTLTCGTRPQLSYCFAFSYG